MIIVARLADTRQYALDRASGQRFAFGVGEAGTRATWLQLTESYGERTLMWNYGRPIAVVGLLAIRDASVLDEGRQADYALIFNALNALSLWRETFEEQEARIRREDEEED